MESEDVLIKSIWDKLIKDKTKVYIFGRLGILIIIIRSFFISNNFTSKCIFLAYYCDNSVEIQLIILLEFWNEDLNLNHNIYDRFALRIKVDLRTFKVLSNNIK